MNALETRAAALAAFRDGDSGNTALEGCVRAGVYGMAGFVRVAPAPALVVGGGLAFAESALDQAELKIPNATLTLGRIPRQRTSSRAAVAAFGNHRRNTAISFTDDDVT